jgi:hypothetical protein
MLINNFPRSFPRRDREPTEADLRFRDRLCQSWFGAQYDAAAGGRNRGSIRHGFQPVRAGPLRQVVNAISRAFFHRPEAPLTIV